MYHSNFHIISFLVTALNESSAKRPDSGRVEAHILPAKPAINRFPQLVVVREMPATMRFLEVVKEMLITRRKIWRVWRMEGGGRGRRRVGKEGEATLTDSGMCNIARVQAHRAAAGRPG